MPSESLGLYKGYINWKQWDTAAASSPDSEKFSQEMSRVALPKNARILEIGFGRGDFLDWARQQGFRVSGIEILPSLVSNAKSRGHQAFLGTLPEVIGDLEGPYDCVVMFDVLEHLPIDEILSYIEIIHTLVKPTGCFIARVPNSTSIVGFFHQHGDITHITPLSAKAFRQIASMTSFRVRYAGNAARSYAAGHTSGRKLQKRVAYALRAIIEICLGYIYFGERIALDPDITVVMQPE